MKRVGYELMLDLVKGITSEGRRLVGAEICVGPSPLKFKIVRIRDLSRSVGVPIPVWPQALCPDRL